MLKEAGSEKMLLTTSICDTCNLLHVFLLFISFLLNYLMVMSMMVIG